MGCYGLGVPRCIDDDYNNDNGEGGINTQLNQYMVYMYDGRHSYKTIRTAKILLQCLAAFTTNQLIDYATRISTSLPVILI